MTAGNPRFGGVPRHPRGVAVIIVLWTVALLSLIATHIVAAGRTDVREAAGLRGSAVAEAAADGAVFVAAFALLGGPNAAPVPPVLHLGQAVVRLTITDERWKVPLNTAPMALLSALLRQVGAGGAEADQLAGEIQAWRNGNARRPPPPAMQQPALPAAQPAAQSPWGPPGEPFRSVDELALLDGLRADLFARLRPHLSVFSQSFPTRTSPDPIVARAVVQLAGNGVTLAALDGPPVMEIVADATTQGGQRFVRAAIVSLAPTSTRPFVVLDWREAPQ